MATFLNSAVILANPEDPKYPGTSDQHIPSPPSGGENGSSLETCTSNAKDEQGKQAPSSGMSEALDFQGQSTSFRDCYSYLCKQSTHDTDTFERTTFRGDIDLSKIRGKGTEFNMNYNEASGVNSQQILSSDDLSVDARVCALPKTVPKKAKFKADKLAEQEITTFDFEKGKDSGIFHNKTDTKCKDDDMKDFIRNLVQKQCAKKHEIKFFDAAIVYDKKDFDKVTCFRDELICMVSSRIKEDLKIELFDSEEFAQSKIMVVEDVIDRCSVILVYISNNLNSPELHLFIEEAIGLSRFGYNDPEFRSGRESSQRQWVLKPVHTKPRKSRDYKTPVGLLTVNGIDWFDRSSEHTISQIISIMQLAVTQRKQRDLEVNTNNAYKDLFGSLPTLPHLGPPFKKPHALSSVNMKQTPSGQATNPLISHPLSPVSHAFQNDYSAVRVDTQPSFLSNPQGTSRLYDDALRLHSHTSLGGNKASPGHSLNTQSRFESRDFPYEHLPCDVQQQYSGYAYPPFSTGTPQLNRPSPQGLSGSQLGYMNQSTGLQNECHPAMQQGQIQMHTNFQSLPMQSPAVVFPPQMDAPQLQQTPVQSPSIHPGSYNPYQNQYLSQDALRSLPGNYTFDQRNDSQLSSQMSVVSAVTGNLIVKSNLSTDDDVEVDNSHTGPISRTASSKDQTGSLRFSHESGDDTDDDTDESDYSSDSDSGEDIPGGRKVIKKVVNIIGCKTVQLGKRNRVKETEKKRLTGEIISEKNKVMKARTCKVTTDESANNVLSKHVHSGKSNSAMNISVSEDNMSVEKSISRDLHNNLNDGYMAENMNRMSNALDSGAQNFHAEQLDVSESNLNSHENRSEQTSRKQKLKLQLSVNRQGGREEGQTDSRKLFSPDDNISEEQLFGFGTESIETEENVDSNRTFKSTTFGFSQLAKKTSNFKHLVHVDFNKTRDPSLAEQNCVYNEPD